MKYLHFSMIRETWKRSKGQYRICSYSTKVVFDTHPHAEQLVFIEWMQQITEFKCQVQILILISKSNSFFRYNFLISTCYCIGILKEDFEGRFGCYKCGTEQCNRTVTAAQQTSVTGPRLPAGNRQLTLPLQSRSQKGMGKFAKSGQIYQCLKGCFRQTISSLLQALRKGWYWPRVAFYEVIPLI